jgi:hypothetical protein
MKEKAFQLIAVFFLAAALYHFAGLFYPVNDAPKWRHTLFVGINALCIYGFLKRPVWFMYAFFVLLVQQLNSHGSALVSYWEENHLVSWIDFSVVLSTPLMFLMLVYDWQDKRRNTSR